MLFGNSLLSINIHDAPGVTIGSLEGNGNVLLTDNVRGERNLTIGSNNLSTTFSGIIADDRVFPFRGSISKIGRGTLTLSGANTYAGGTIVNGGQLLVANQSGSATGQGPVLVGVGSLGGTGRISGNVTVGTGNPRGAFITPGMQARVPATLAIGRKLRFRFAGNFEFGFRSSNLTADKVVARAVTIDSGARMVFDSIDPAPVSIGTVFTAISNTGPTPIAGTFANVPDDSNITVGNNAFHADYEGGDGNDLTLTVVP